MGEAVVGAFLPLLEKLALDKWNTTLTEIEEVLNDAEEKQLTQPLVKSWLDDLKDLVYDVEDILEAFTTKMLKRRIEKQQGSTSKLWISSLSKPKFNFGMNSEIKKITDRLEEISTREKRFGLKRLGVSTDPWTMPQTTSQLDEPVIGRDEDKKQIVDELLSKEETCTSNFQVAKDIVDDTNGSAVSRPSIGSHDYNSFGQTPQATGHDDSNPLLYNIGSDHAVTSNSVPDHAVRVGRYEDKKQIVDELLSKEETCTSNFQVAKEDIVGDTNGSAVSRPSIGSHDYNSYGQTPQATFQGQDDSNPLVHNIGSDHAVTSNSVSDHAGPYGSRLEQGFSPLSVTDQHGTRVTTSDWIFSATGLGFEAVSACFDQVSSPQKPDYALYGMLLSIVAVLVSTLDLIRNARKQRKLSASNMLWGILPEVFGLALAYIQCISSALQFSFLRRHAENPVKVSLLPFLFFFVLFAFKYRNGRN